METKIKPHVFCYRIKDRWPCLTKKNRKIFRDWLLECIECRIATLEDSKLRYVYQTGSALNQFGYRQQIKLMELLRDAVLGKNEDKTPITDSNSLLFEQLLFGVVEDSWVRLADLVEDMPESEYVRKEYEDLKKIVHFSYKIPFNEIGLDEIQEFLESDDFWWDRDWEIFQPNELQIAKLKANL